MKKKKKLFMSLSVLLVSFLIIASSLNVISTEALQSEDLYDQRIETFDRKLWEWNKTEVISTNRTSD